MIRLFCAAAFILSFSSGTAFAKDAGEQVKLSLDSTNNVNATTIVSYVATQSPTPSCSEALNACMGGCSPIAQPGVQECYNNCRTNDYECYSYCYDGGLNSCGAVCYEENKQWCEV